MTSSASGQSAQTSLPPNSRSRYDTDAGQEDGISSPSHGRPNERYEFFKVIQTYLDKAARVLGMPEYVRRILSQPKNEIIVNFPVRMDNGEYRLFKGYRIQHNNILGPYKGGMRYHEAVALDDLQGARGDDDVEVRAHESAVRRRQGRHQVQPAQRLARRAAAHHAPLHPRARLEHRPRVRHPRARRRHQRADHGLGDGHVHEHGRHGVRSRP